MISRKIWLFLVFVFFLALFSCRAPVPGPRPNIIIILADDLGYGCTGAYGADKNLLETPAIDSLARQGRRFTRAYTPSSVCSPTRYALLTGEYQWRKGRKYGVEDLSSPLCISRKMPTIVSRLKKAGYRTAAIGKWHLGYQESKVRYDRPLRPGPLELGFDYHWGIPVNHGDRTGVWVENDRVYGLVQDMSMLPAGRRQPETNHSGSPMLGIPAPFRADTSALKILDQRASGWIDKQSPDTPFFLYYATPAVHVPLTPSEKFKGASRAGPLGDFIMELDASVAGLIAALERNGFSSNSIVIFTSDNGAHPAGAAAAIKAGLKLNGDLRGKKMTIWEGGFRVPLIIKWPGHIPPGTASSETVNLADIYASLMEALGLEMGPPSKEAADSYSFFPAWSGDLKKPVRDNMIYTSFEGITALQAGGWKYIEGIVADSGPSRNFNKYRRKHEARERLYNLHQDPGERKNLINKNPDRALKMKNMLKKIREQGHSRPARQRDEGERAATGTPPVNLLTNGSFENGLAGWQIKKPASIAAAARVEIQDAVPGFTAGSKHLYLKLPKEAVDNQKQYIWAGQTLNLSKTKKYKYSVKVKWQKPAGHPVNSIVVSCWARNPDNSYNGRDEWISDTDPTVVSFSFTPNESGSVFCYIALLTHPEAFVANDLLVDDFKIEEIGKADCEADPRQANLNLLSNPGFEDNFSGWTPIENNPNQVPGLSRSIVLADNSKKMRLELPGAADNISLNKTSIGVRQEVMLYAGNTYRLTAEIDRVLPDGRQYPTIMNIYVLKPAASGSGPSWLGSVDYKFNRPERHLYSKDIHILETAAYQVTFRVFGWGNEGRPLKVDVDAVQLKLVSKLDHE